MVSTSRPIVLQAGDLQLKIVEGSVREITWAGNEAIARLYVAVRVEDWETIPLMVESLRVEQADDQGFTARLECRHVGHGADVRWDGILQGRSDGKLRFSVVARVQAPRNFNRIGICLLHRSRLLKGSHVLAYGTSHIQEMDIPSQVTPQWVVGNGEFGMTEPFRKVVLQLTSGLKVVETYDGAMFELEDERNFGDGFFKIYGPPTRDGYPLEKRTGNVVKQSVAVQFSPKSRQTRGEPASSRSKVKRASTQVEFSASGNDNMPPIGIDQRALGSEPLAVDGIRNLRAISPSHLRSDIDLNDDHWSDRLAESLRVAESAKCLIECAVSIEDVDDVRLEQLTHIMAGNNTGFARLLVYANLLVAPSPSLMQMTIRMLGRSIPNIPLFAATDDLYAINKDRPQYSNGLGVAFGTNPGVHLADDEIAFEGLFGQADGVANIRALYPYAPVAVTPITIAQPSVAFRILASESDGSEKLALADDLRLDTTTGAAWIAGSVSALVSAGAASLTYANAIGGKHPRPLVHVLAAACAMKGLPLLDFRIEKADLVSVVGVERRLSYSLIAANLQPRAVDFDIALPLDAVAISRHVLNEHTLSDATMTPSSWRRNDEVLNVRVGRVKDRLSAHAVAFYTVQRNRSKSHLDPST